MKAVKVRPNGLTPIRKQNEWKLLYLQFPLEGKGNGAEPSGDRESTSSPEESTKPNLVHKR
jgi:hypothetical protein